MAKKTKKTESVLFPATEKGIVQFVSYLQEKNLGSGRKEGDWYWFSCTSDQYKEIRESCAAFRVFFRGFSAKRKSWYTGDILSLPAYIRNAEKMQVECTTDSVGTTYTTSDGKPLPKMKKNIKASDTEALIARVKALGYEIKKAKVKS